MKSKFFMTGILSAVLVFGMMVVGCSNDSGSDSGNGTGGGGNDWLVGTWKKGSGTASGTLITLNADKTWSISSGQNGSPWEVEGNTLNLKGDNSGMLTFEFLKDSYSLNGQVNDKLKITSSPNKTDWVGDWYKQ